jgi:hypothetical protein
MTLCGYFYSDMNIPIFVPFPVPIWKTVVQGSLKFVCTYMVATDAQLSSVEYFSSLVLTHSKIQCKQKFMKFKKVPIVSRTCIVHNWIKYIISCPAYVCHWVALRLEK